MLINIIMWIIYEIIIKYEINLRRIISKIGWLTY